MIANIPTHEDFAEHGTMFLNLAWEAVFDLILDFNEADDWREDFDADEWEQGTEKYWRAAKKPLSMAHALAQQGAELILKSKIASVSPFLLIGAQPSDWPKGCDKSDTAFAEFKTIDAQDLVRTYNTIADEKLPDSFIATFNKFRKQRNALFHTVDDRLDFSDKEIITYILESIHLVSPQKWPFLRRNYLEQLPIAFLGGTPVSYRMWHEMDNMIELMGRSNLKRWFGFNKNQRRYICPRCYWDKDCDHEIGYPETAQLKPNTATSDNLFCFVCDQNMPVVRQQCSEPDCKGNVINARDDQECLICFECCELDSEE